MAEATTTTKNSKKSKGGTKSASFEVYVDHSKETPGTVVFADVENDTPPIRTLYLTKNSPLAKKVLAGKRLKVTVTVVE